MKDNPQSMMNVPYDRLVAHAYGQHTPPQRTWVGLTDEERDAMIESTDLSGAYYYDDLYAVILAAEAKLKEKNT